MGCACSSKKKSEKQVRKIKAEMPPIGIPKFDEFFKQASELLKQAEELRAPLQDSMEFLIESCDVDALTSKPESELLEAFKVWMWSLAACNGGKLENIKIAVLEKEPYINMDESKISIEGGDFLEHMKKWKETIISSPPKIEELVKSLEKTAEDAIELVKTCIDDAKDANLGLSEALTAAKNSKKSVGRLGKGVTKCKNLVPLVKEALKALLELCKHLPAEIKKADEMGAKALAKNLRKP